MRVTEVSTEQRRNEGREKRKIPRKPTDQRHRPGVPLPGIESDSPCGKLQTPCKLFTVRLNAGKAEKMAQWLGRSPPTAAIRARYPAGSLPDFRMWESCWTMPLARRVFSEYSRFPRPRVPAPLYSRISFHATSGDDRVAAGNPVTRKVWSVSFGAENWFMLLRRPSRSRFDSPWGLVRWRKDRLSMLVDVAGQRKNSPLLHGKYFYKRTPRGS
ncbi:hypothetical protein PR048_006235 [Dryococelus australis]|uniref:Uncharacterized protein n=1 Tax=Dryococelus australis TaxID=614101 RepID=A0ABQ9IBN0_9NEOP|nr:hypothetical protein PR048_006235 [Dryococelus australis]